MKGKRWKEKLLSLRLEAEIPEDLNFKEEARNSN